MSINQIQNQELGLSVRTKLNEVVDYVNATSGSIDKIPFAQNRTTEVSSSIKQYQSVFNPTNLLIQDSNIFIVEQNAEYYVLNDVTNSGSLQVDGTLIIDGILTNLGTITGTGPIL